MGKDGGAGTLFQTAVLDVAFRIHHRFFTFASPLAAAIARRRYPEKAND